MASCSLPPDRRLWAAYQGSTPSPATGVCDRSSQTASPTLGASPREDVIAAAKPQSTPNGAQAALLETLEAAFGGDPGSRIFLQAALRTARRASLPTDPDAILDFARAHLLDALTAELGPRAVAEFLEALTKAVWARPASGVEPVAEVHVSERDLAYESARRMRASNPALHAQPTGSQSTRGLPASLPGTEPRSSSRARLRMLLVHSDRFARASLARHLVAGGCDVTVIESFTDIATIVDALPAVALVDLAARDVEQLLQGLVVRNPRLHVLAILALGVDAEAILEAARVESYETVLRPVRGPELMDTLRRLAAP